MMNRGKQDLVYFDRQTLNTLFKYFCQMDEHKRGYLGVSDIEETLLTLGLANSKADVIDRIQTVCKQEKKEPSIEVDLSTPMIISQEQVVEEAGIKVDFE